MQKRAIAGLGTWVMVDGLLHAQVNGHMQSKPWITQKYDGFKTVNLVVHESF